MGGSGSSRLAGSSSSVCFGPLQRQHGHGLGVGLIDVFFHRFFDLRGKIAGVAGVPHRVARGDHRGGQPPSKRTMFERLSNTSWPLMASILQRLPWRMATLRRSHSISRRPSLAMV